MAFILTAVEKRGVEMVRMPALQRRLELKVKLSPGHCS